MKLYIFFLLFLLFTLCFSSTDYYRLPESILVQDSDGNTAVHISLIQLIHSQELNTPQEEVFDLLSQAAVNTDMNILKQLCSTINNKRETILDLLQQIPDCSISEIPVKTHWINLWGALFELSTLYNSK